MYSLNILISLPHLSGRLLLLLVPEGHWLKKTKWSPGKPSLQHRCEKNSVIDLLVAHIALPWNYYPSVFMEMAVLAQMAQLLEILLRSIAVGGVLVTLGISSLVTNLQVASFPTTTGVTLPRHLDKGLDAYWVLMLNFWESWCLLAHVLNMWPSSERNILGHLLGRWQYLPQSSHNCF